MKDQNVVDDLKPQKEASNDMVDEEPQSPNQEQEEIIDLPQIIAEDVEEAEIPIIEEDNGSEKASVAAVDIIEQKEEGEDVVGEIVEPEEDEDLIDVKELEEQK